MPPKPGATPAPSDEKPGTAGSNPGNLTATGVGDKGKDTLPIAAGSVGSRKSKKSTGVNNKGSPTAGQPSTDAKGSVSSTTSKGSAKPKKKTLTRLKRKTGNAPTDPEAIPPPSPSPEAPVALPPIGITERLFHLVKPRQKGTRVGPEEEQGPEGEADAHFFTKRVILIFLAATILLVGTALIVAVILGSNEAGGVGGLNNTTTSTTSTTLTIKTTTTTTPTSAPTTRYTGTPTPLPTCNEKFPGIGDPSALGIYCKACILNNQGEECGKDCCGKYYTPDPPTVVYEICKEQCENFTLTTVKPG